MATQFSRMFRHPHKTQEVHLGGHPATRLGTVPKNGREQTQNCTFEGAPYTAVLLNLDVRDELLEILRRAVWIRAYADLNGEMSERVFGCSFYLKLTHLA